MNLCRLLLFLLLTVVAVPSTADVPGEAHRADVVFLGEVHDNPAHHAEQARWVAALKPRALVFEMLTPEAARRVTPDLVRDPAALGQALEWEEAGWPDFGMYYPIFEAAEGRIYGAAVPREIAREIIRKGPMAALSPADVARFGLDEPLTQAQQTARLALQKAAHCDALPETLLPGMVTIQRVRDAALAGAALAALDETGGPVVVITGNGHARRDWGAPATIGRAAPSVAVFALGQSEDGQDPDGAFDMILDAPAVQRADPCAAFE